LAIDQPAKLVMESRQSAVERFRISRQQKGTSRSVGNSVDHDHLYPLLNTIAVAAARKRERIINFDAKRLRL